MSSADVNFLASTSPYVSVILAQTVSEEKHDLVDKIVDDLIADLGLDSGTTARKLIRRERQNADGFECSFFHYSEQRAPSWLKVEQSLEIWDYLNHLGLVMRSEAYLALFASDPVLRTIISRRLIGRENSGAFTFIRRISQKTLTDAFIEGPTRTLWLSALHRRTAVKADSKVLSGIDLQFALNPLDDQTYHFTAARSMAVLNGSAKPVGFSQRRSIVWLGLSKNWTDFRSQVKSVLEAVNRAAEQPKRLVAPLPVLASPVAGLNDVRDAFDVALVPPELLADDRSQDDVRQQEVAKWAYRGRFEIESRTALDVTINGYLDDVQVGKAELKVRIEGDEQVVVDVSGEAEPGLENDFQELRTMLEDSRLLKVRFDSGHVLSDGMLFLQRFRDLPFEGWKFVSLGEADEPCGTLVTKEKPTQATGTGFSVRSIGESDSLFCWVRRNWFDLQFLATRDGWLACDDGAGEIADFISLDLNPDDGGIPRVTLVHVKGSGSRSLDRGISVSDYEVVCGQAVKNLRFLDHENLVERLSLGVGNEIASATWQGANHVGDRTSMLEELKKLGFNYRRRVVVFQPRVRKFELGRLRAVVRAGTAGAAEGNRLRQLDALLLAVEADCRDLGADFVVLASDC